MSADYTLTEAVNSAITKALSGIHTCLPGRIEKYDYTKQLASVTPLIRKKFTNGSTLSMPVIENVPVIWPRGGDASLTFPLEKGDGALLVFSERSLDEWLTLGGEADPGAPTMFDLSDAIAVPGLNSFNVASHAGNNNDVALTRGGTKVSIKKNGDVDIESSGAVNIKSGDIKLGDGLLHKTLLTEDFLNLVYSLHVHPAPGGTTSAPTPISAPTQLTSKTKAE